MGTHRRRSAGHSDTYNTAIASEIYYYIVMLYTHTTICMGCAVLLCRRL